MKVSETWFLQQLDKGTTLKILQHSWEQVIYYIINQLFRYTDMQVIFLHMYLHES